jgi:hypothetical protein
VLCFPKEVAPFLTLDRDAYPQRSGFAKQPHAGKLKSESHLFAAFRKAGSPSFKGDCWLDAASLLRQVAEVAGAGQKERAHHPPHQSGCAVRVGRRMIDSHALSRTTHAVCHCLLATALLVRWLARRCRLGQTSLCARRTNGLTDKAKVTLTTNAKLGLFLAPLIKSFPLQLGSRARESFQEGGGWLAPSR